MPGTALLMYGFAMLSVGLAKFLIEATNVAQNDADVTGAINTLMMQ